MILNMWKLDLAVLEFHFCVWSMDHRTAWNEWIMLLDAQISVFAWFYGVLILSIHPSLPVRENCPFWLLCNVQTSGSDNWFWHMSVTIFVQFMGTSFLSSKAYIMTIANLLLDGQVDTHLHQRRFRRIYLSRQMRPLVGQDGRHIDIRKLKNIKTPLSEMKIFAFPMKKSVACKLNC